MSLSIYIWYKFLNPERTKNIYRYTQPGPENLNHTYLPKHDFASSLFSLALLYFSMFLPRHMFCLLLEEPWPLQWKASTTVCGPRFFESITSNSLPCYIHHFWTVTWEILTQASSQNERSAWKQSSNLQSVMTLPSPLRYTQSLAEVVFYFTMVKNELKFVLFIF